MLVVKHELAQPCRPDRRERRRRAGRAGRRAACRRIGHAGRLRPGAGAAARDAAGGSGATMSRPGASWRAAIADHGDVPIDGMTHRGGDRLRSATPARPASARHALTLLVGGNNAVTRPRRPWRAGPAAGAGRADHARRPFRHARHRRRAWQRQSGAGAARGWAAGAQHRPDRPGAVRQFGGDAPRRDRRRASGRDHRRGSRRRDRARRSPGARSCRAIARRWWSIATST